MRSEGIRRLSILLGLLGLLGWIIFAFVVTECFTDVKLQGWFILFIGLPTSFFLPFWVVRGIAWVVEGFRSDKPEK